MYAKYYTLILTFLFSSIFGQISLEFTLINSIAHVTIHNKSTDNYIIPVDRNHFRPYEKNCDLFSEHESEFPSFGLLVNVITLNNRREDYTIGYKYFDDFDSLNKKMKRKRDAFQKKIRVWGRKNNITDYNTSLINYNLINNLIYLKPNEKITFKIKLDLYNITSQELIFYNYILKKDENYILYLNLCEFDIYKYLTSSQKKKFKNYKFFTGKLESNKITLQ